MKLYITKIVFALAFSVLTVIQVSYADNYSVEYEAEHKVKTFPSSKGGTVGQYLDKKARIPAIEDLGWTRSQYSQGVQVERIMLLGTTRLVYRWNVDLSGNVTAVNGKAMGITK